MAGYTQAATVRLMEASARIVDAMRQSVAERGTAGSTFDQVAREAGVSRGLLHYHFGTKERLIAEVVRRDAEIRLKHLGSELGGRPDAVDDVIATLAALAGGPRGARSGVRGTVASSCSRPAGAIPRSPPSSPHCSGLRASHVAELLAAKRARGRGPARPTLRRPSRPCCCRSPTASRCSLLGEPEHDHRRDTWAQPRPPRA